MVDHVPRSFAYELQLFRRALSAFVKAKTHALRLGAVSICEARSMHREIREAHDPAMASGIPSEVANVTYLIIQKA